MLIVLTIFSESMPLEGHAALLKPNKFNGRLKLYMEINLTVGDFYRESPNLIHRVLSVTQYFCRLLISVYPYFLMYFEPRVHSMTLYKCLKANCHVTVYCDTYLGTWPMVTPLRITVTAWSS